MAKKRAKSVKSEYTKSLEKFHENSGRHVVKYEADIPEDTKRHIFELADNLRQASNAVRGIMNCRLEQLLRTKAYRGLQTDYKYYSEKLKTFTEGSKEYKSCSDEKNNIGKQMENMQSEFLVTFDEIRQMMSQFGKELNIGSIFCLREAENIWKGVSSVLFSKGKRLHFKSRTELPCICAKQCNRGIVVKPKGDTLQLSVELQTRRKVDGSKNRIRVKQRINFGLIVPEDDRFLKDELENMLAYLEYPNETDRTAVEHYIKSGEVIDTHRICYAALKCVVIRGKLRVYVLFTVEGKACAKYNKDGTLRHNFAKSGIVGVDIGTQTVAVVSGKKLLLTNLGERCNKSSFESEAYERRLQRKMDRSRRASNPDNFNANGTVKPRNKRKPWKYSKSYRKTLKLRRELARKNADSRKYANQELANDIRELGCVLVTEPKNAEKLKRKAKTSKVAIRADGTKKHSKRKRFGRSIQNRCPGGFQAELKNKFGTGYIEVPYKYRASQYDHTAGNNGDYIKKNLNQRMYALTDGSVVQRDLYSAYLMYNHNAEITSPDNRKCKDNFPVFVISMNTLIQEIVESGHKVCNSGIKM